MKRSKQSASDSLGKLRSLRANKQKNLEIKGFEPIYEEVTEDIYNDLAKKALLKEDFVIDDTNGEYTGLVNWDERSDRSESSESDHGDTKKSKPKKKAEKKEEFIKKMKAKRPREVVQTETDKEIVQDIMNDIENDATQRDFSAKKLKKKTSQPIPSKRKIPSSFAEMIQPRQMSFSELLKVKKDYPSNSDPVTQGSAADESFGMDVDHFDPPSFDPVEDEKVIVKEEIKIKEQHVEVKAVQVAKATKDTKNFMPKFVKEEAKNSNLLSAPKTDNKNWKDLKDTVLLEKEVTNPANNISKQDLVCGEEGLYLYWIDAYESKGKVYLFGKVMVQGIYTSCCVTVENMNRHLFVLPREYQRDDPEEPVTMADVYAEFDVLRKKHNIKEFMSKPVTRHYAFELPNIPSESEYLKVAYPFTEPQLPLGLEGNCFSHIFGTNTNPLEIFLIKRKIKGPGWLKIKNAALSKKNLSWCKFEISVDDMKDIEPSDNGKMPAPPLVVMSLNLRTVMNMEKNANEIVAACTFVYKNVSADKDSEEQTGIRNTFIRKLKDTPWPLGFEQACMDRKSKVFVQGDEKQLLNTLLSTIYRHDPDIIVGHNFIDFDLDVLLQRMKHHGVAHWSRLGRLSRNQWPKLQAGAGGTSDSTYAERQICSGRLLCDTFRTAKDLLSSKSYSLSFLAETQLDISRPDIEYSKIADYFWDRDLLLTMLDHCEFDTKLVADLMFKLQVIPMTKQLTNVAGNLWNRTLTGARAERNEYLLLHEFHSKKYICPDKVQKFETNEDGEKIVQKGRRKAAYAGGLVLEPKAGLYDKFVLLLDFNSLYPSIIQEYNICFTTVERTYEGQEAILPELPARDDKTPLAILPKLLKALVDSRRAVKAEMKKVKEGTPEYAQYDIRQKAYKLTANSMYGCLGFVHSRFCAKPIAMLITHQGREILQRTVHMVEEKHLEVIYGDTDSIMINTNSTEVAQAKEIAEQVKVTVNNSYKLLEIELDGLFKKLLLLKKKKYAALIYQEKNGVVSTKREDKGLDIVRRDWCDLSHDVSEKVLTYIFGDDTIEESVLKIHEYLQTIQEEVKADLVPVDKFVINKGLTKNPKDYADRDNQPHVQVALRMISKGLVARMGDTIPYVICKGEKVISKNLGSRAFHVDEVTDPANGIEVDVEWYLENQVLPPISRLCGCIEGTDNARLAAALGLDIKKYQQTSLTLDEEKVFTLVSQLSLEERFKDVTKFNPTCIFCKKENVFEEAFRKNNGRLECNFNCYNCERSMPEKYLVNKLTSAIQRQLRRYLDQSVVCDDQMCKSCTRMVGVYGQKCIQPYCQGIVSLQFPDSVLYAQLQYFDYLFDKNRLVKEYYKKNDDAKLLVNTYGAYYDSLHKVVQRYLDISSRHWVNLGDIFNYTSITR